MLNYVEDRRIDYYVFSSSPGYKGYYQALYDKYFNSKIIDKGLKSDMLRDLELERDMRLAMIPELRKKANIPVITMNL